MQDLINKITNDYIDDVLVRLAHHSSALEGNTISLAETATIILDQTLPHKGNISNREFFEVINHQPAFDYILNQINQNNQFSVENIKTIHRILTDRLQHDSGQFKVHSNYIQGAEFKTADPAQVPLLMNQYVDNLNYRLSNAEDNQCKIYSILESHIEFEKIHLFSDGNGRTGRMIMNYLLLKESLPPLIIRKEDKAIYNALLHKGQTEGVDEDLLDEWYQFVHPLMKEEENRITGYYEQHKQQIQFDESE